MNYIGIDIGGTNVKMALVSIAGEIIKRSSFKTHGAREPEEVIDEIASEVKKLAGDVDYLAIGVGCPGAIDTAAGIVNYSPNLQWRNVPLADMLSRKTGKTVRAANDAACAALGEHKFGVGKGRFTDTAMITLGTGVGGGFVVDGKLFQGYKSMGGEVGHTVIRVNGQQCTCGRKGCFEAYASATALIRETRKALNGDKNQESMMWDYLGLKRGKRKYDLYSADGRAAFACAKKGDPIASKVINNYIENLSAGVINVINTFRSQAVILGGGVCAEETLATRVQAYVDEYRYGGKDSLPAIVLNATLGNDAGILGAASLVADC